MYLMIICESSIACAEQLKTTRAMFGKVFEVASLEHRFFAQRVKNRCRMYFFVKSSFDLSPDIFVRIASLYAPTCYFHFHDFQRENVHTIKNNNCITSKCSFTSISDVIPRLRIPDNMKSDLATFFSLNIIHSSF